MGEPQSRVRPAGFPRSAQGWPLRALCRDHDPELFFFGTNERGPSKRRREEGAKRVCGGCPVKAECLDWAIEADERYGVWGGLTPEERDALNRTGRTLVSRLNLLLVAAVALLVTMLSGVAGGLTYATNGGAVYHFASRVVDVDGSRLTGSWPAYERWAVEALRLGQPGVDVHYRACRAGDGCVRVLDSHRGRVNPGETYFAWYSGTKVLAGPVTTRFNLDYPWTWHSKAQAAMHELLTSLGETYRYTTWKGSALYLWLDPHASIRPAAIDLDRLRRAYA